MRYLVFALLLIFIGSGCSNTIRGVKEDAHNAKEWTKERINEGATYIKEKTD